MRVEGGTPRRSDEKKSVRVRNLVVAMTAVICASWAVHEWTGLRVFYIRSVSVPGYVFLAVPTDPQDVAPGDRVAVCLSGAPASTAVERGYARLESYCGPGEVGLLKMATAASGSIVEITRSGVVVDGRLTPNSVSLDRDALGRELPDLRGSSFKLRSDEVWLHGTAPRSFDSRYYGPVDFDRRYWKTWRLL